jgi:lipid-binding SYLF domain-containing protein
VPLAKELTKIAEAILVFPEIKRAGFMVGGQYGEGALLKKGAAVAAQLDTANGFEVGVGLQGTKISKITPK